jgi:hypothetical protein
LGWKPYLLGTTAIVGLFSSISWLSAKNELDGRRFWILGMSVLSVASAARGNLDAARTWGLGLLLSGGLLFLYSTGNKWLSVFPLLGWIGFSALPFSPTWHGNGLYTGWSPWMVGIFILIQALMTLGYVRHVFRPFRPKDEIERWGWVIYPLGLGVMVITHFGMSIFLGDTSTPDGPVLSTLWWGGALAFSLAALLWILAQNYQEFIPNLINVFLRISSLGWIYRSLWWIYRTLSSMVDQAGLVLEGQGGILWAVLVLILLMTAIAQRVGG